MTIQKNSSIEERLYSYFHGAFASLEERVTYFPQEEKASLEHDFKKFEPAITILSYATGLSALWLGSDVASDCIHHTASPISMYFTSTLTATSGFLSVHFHYAQKLYTAVNEKVFQKKAPFSKTDIEEWRSRGRNAHLAAIISFGGLTIPPLVFVIDAYPVLGGCMLGIGGFAAYHNLFRGYSALYNAQADFLVGTKRA